MNAFKFSMRQWKNTQRNILYCNLHIDWGLEEDRKDKDVTFSCFSRIGSRQPLDGHERA